MSILNPAGTFFAVLIGSSKPLGLAFWSTVLLVLTAYELAGHLRLRGVWTLEEVVQTADRAMCEAKSLGRRQVRVYAAL